MKNLVKVVSVLFLIQFIVSCESDDDSISSNNEKELTRMIQKRYEDGGFIEKITFDYEDNLIKKDSFFNVNNDFTYYDIWQYNSVNNLVSLKGYNSDNTLNSETNHEFDSSNRLTQVDRVYYEGSTVYNSTITFSYNTNNTIVSMEDYGGSSILEKTFYLDSQDRIYKSVSMYDTIEIFYDAEGNVSSMDWDGDITTYTYEQSHTVPESFRPAFFKEYINNNILWQNDLSIGNNIHGNRFSIQSETSSEINTTNYIYDEDGYPVSSTSFWNGELTNEHEFFYNQ